MEMAPPLMVAVAPLSVSGLFVMVATPPLRAVAVPLTEGSLIICI